MGWLKNGGRSSSAGAGDGAARSPSTLPGDELDLMALVSVLLRQWAFILLVTALFVGLAGAYTVVAPKTWRATTRVLLDPRDKIVVGPGLTQPLQGVDIGWVDTQANIVTSAEALSAVVRSQRLETDPEFEGSFEETMRHFAEAVTVERADLTYVLAISVTTRSAEKSARLSAALSEAFVSTLVDAKAKSARQVSDLLATQLDDLREKARAADEKLQAYRREKGLLTANGRQVDEDTLRQLNESYIAAAQRTREAQTRRDSLRRILNAGGTQFDSNLDAVNSAVVTRLKVEYALAARQVANLSEELGPSHPRMTAARADLERARSLVVDELRSLAQTAAIDYEVALANEQDTRRALDEATGAVNAASAAGVELRQLETDANVRRELYLNFVQRLEQTGLQENTQVSDARIIEPAPIPVRPYAPRRSLILSFALLAGLGIGISGALYRGRGDLLALAGGGPAGDPEPASPEPAAAAVAKPQSAYPRRDVAVAELAIDTRPPRGGLFRRNAADRAAPLRSGVADAEGLAAFGAFLAQLADQGRGKGPLLVVGTASPAAVAAVAFGLARAASEDGRAVLLADASADESRLADAVLDGASAGLVDVACRDLAPKDLPCHVEAPDVTVVSAGRRDDPLLDERAADVARFLGELSGRFDLCVVDLGRRVRPAILDALADGASDIVLVVDAADRNDRATGSMVRDLAASLPGLSGVVLAKDRAGGARPRRVA